MRAGRQREGPRYDGEDDPDDPGRRTTRDPGWGPGPRRLDASRKSRRAWWGDLPCSLYRHWKLFHMHL